MADRCDALTKRGAPCKGRPLPGKRHCLAHDPTYAQARREGSLKGGAAKATAKRAAKQWAALGKELGNEDIPAILKSCMFAVRSGEMTPGEANAIATLARTAVQITGDLELEARIAELEAMMTVKPSSNVRRLA